ncbi:MAG: DivIVA domain-containing protein [Rhodothermales bacterium]|nr:DivIVA domain-containing protein [Rhodothermales bacterium]
MRLSPLDIKKQEFNRGFRGFEEQEVTAYLQMLADQWDELINDHRNLESKVTDLENKLVHYQRVEDALQEALNTAKSSSKTKIANAEQEAALILREAQAKAEELLQKARAGNQALRQSNLVLEQRQQQVISRLKAFLSSEMDMLAGFEKQPLPPSPEPVDLPSPQPASNGDHGHSAVIHNVEIDVDKYSDDTVGDQAEWSSESDQQEFGESDYFEPESIDNSTDTSFNPDSAETNPPHNADRPPLRDNASASEMDKIRKILDNLE